MIDLWHLSIHCFLWLSCFEGVSTSKVSLGDHVSPVWFRLVTELPMSAYPHGNSFSLTASEYVERLSVIVQTNDTRPSFSTFKKRGDPWLWSSGGQEKGKQDDRQFPQLSKGSQVGTGDPLTDVTRGVQCWRTRQLRRSHVIFPIVFCTWVRDSLSVPCWQWYCCCQSCCG